LGKNWLLGEKNAYHERKRGGVSLGRGKRYLLRQKRGRGSCSTWEEECKGGEKLGVRNGKKHVTF